MNAMTNGKQLERLLNGVAIPPCPAILLDINRELAKEAPHQRQIAHLVSRDVALSGHVMLVANSLAVSAGHEVDSIVQALNILGTRQLFNEVVLQLLKSAMADHSDRPMERFWETSAETARVSAELARRLRCIRPDVAYTFGLFHDCGIPLLMKRFPQFREVLAVANTCGADVFTAIEDHQLGTNHAITGYFLAHRWRLPDEVADAILHHHDYAVLTQPGVLPLKVCMLIAVAVLAEHIIRSRAGDRVFREWRKAAPYVCELFDLSPKAVDDLIENMCDWLG